MDEGYGLPHQSADWFAMTFFESAVRVGRQGERVAAVKILSGRRKAAKKFWAPQQDYRPLRMGTCGYEFGDQRRNGYEKVRILWERS